MDYMPPSNRPAVPVPEAEAAPLRPPLVPERSDFLEGDAPAAARVEAFLANALAATGGDAPTTAGALDLRRPPVEPLGQGLWPGPDGLPVAHAGPGRDAAGGHRRPRQVLQAGVARGRK